MLTNHNTQRLQDDILDALNGLGELDDALALKVATLVLDRLQERRGGQMLWVPPKTKRYPIAAVKEAYANSEPVRSICRRLGLSRSTLYRLLRS